MTQAVPVPSLAGVRERAQRHGVHFLPGGGTRGAGAGAAPEDQWPDQRGQGRASPAERLLTAGAGGGAGEPWRVQPT